MKTPALNLGERVTSAVTSSRMRPTPTRNTLGAHITAGDDAAAGCGDAGRAALLSRKIYSGSGTCRVLYGSLAKLKLL